MIEPISLRGNPSFIVGDSAAARRRPASVGVDGLAEPPRHFGSCARRAGGPAFGDEQVCGSAGSHDCIRLGSPGNERTSGLPRQGSPAGSVGRPIAFEFSVAAPAPAARPRTNHGAVDAAALLRSQVGQISMSIASGQSVAVQVGSSGAWGRLLVRSGRRPRSLVSRGFRSRYYRSEDGHPSPSPDRKWINDGTERALMIGRTHQVLIRVPRAYTSVARTEESAHDAAWPGSAGSRPSVVFMIACVVDARGPRLDGALQALRDRFVTDPARASNPSVA